MTASIREVPGVSALLDAYDVFLLDQFGVLHDGGERYPGAVAALEVLAAAGKHVAIISNSGKRSAVNEARMTRIGFDRRLYHALVTSGEVGWCELDRSQRSGPDGAPVRCYLVTSRDDDSPVAGLDVELVADSGEADVVLVAGAEGYLYPESHYRSLLAPAAARGARCVCTNPDKIALNPEGRHYGPGRIAEIYAELGGEVQWIGKPYPAIYREALARLPRVPASRVVCIGDSVEHDIAGADAAGVDSVLVRGGIWRDATPAELEALYARHEVLPTCTMPVFEP